VTRVKVDGILQKIRSPINKANVDEVVNRIKIMARLDISERRAPQDGRLTLPVDQGGKLYEVPFRISITPARPARTSCCASSTSRWRRSI